MNHLAHLFLASREPDSLAGNLAADWVKGGIGDRFSEGIRDAIRMHRRIDAFVDDHPATLRACGRLGIGRYAPIVVDVVNDFLLATSWEEVSASPLPVFAESVYTALSARRERLPDPLQGRLPRMIENRWLERFDQPEQIERILGYLGGRLRRPGPVAKGFEIALPHLPGLRSDLLGLLPDVVAFARTIDSGAAPFSRV